MELVYGWAEDVSKALIDLIEKYKHRGEYAVFDFDNTISIFDVAEQCAVYQIEHMAFAIKPDDMADILITDLSKDYLTSDVIYNGENIGTYSDWIYDIVSSYSYLYYKYGPFTYKGVDEKTMAKMHTDCMWSEFAVKLRKFYSVIDSVEGSMVSYPWISYWFCGMTEDEIYSLAMSSHKRFMSVKTELIEWKSPDIKSRAGIRDFTARYGITVTENMKELIKTLYDNGIDVWICSASPIEVIRAGIDAFGLHPYVKGMIGMTTKTDSDGRYIPEYDFDGHPYLTDGDKWIKDYSCVSGAKIQSVGKVTAIDNILVPKYEKGPVAGFMDSTGDYNFCTEYSNMKLVVCFNRADRGAREGGGVIAEIAVYEKEVLGYDLETAEKNGDTLYVLQGRDENGMRTLRADAKTVRINHTEPELFKSEENYMCLEYMKENRLPIGQYINLFAEKNGTEVNGVEIGFIEGYRGYHNR